MKKFLYTNILFFALILFSNIVFAQNNLWVKDVTSAAGLDDARGSRIVIIDVNNDDYPDLFWGTGNAGKNKFYLYLNIENPDKNSPQKRIFQDFTEESGINVNRNPNKDGRVIDIVALADVDNDGDVDLVSSIYYHRLEYYKDTLDPGDRSEVYLNDGTGHFTLKPDNGLYDLQVLDWLPAGLINTSGLSFLDYDMDGKIDLYMCTWFGDRKRGIGMPDILMKGNGDGSFTNTKMQIFTSNYYPMYGVNVTDWDNDGWPDILTSAYCNSNGNLFKNLQDGTFQDYSQQANYSAAHFKGDNGQTLCQWEAQPADYDNDGDMDILQVFVHGGYDRNEGRTHVSVNEGPQKGFWLEPELDLIHRDAPHNSHLGDQGGQWFDLNGDGFEDIAIGQMAYPQANRAGQERLYICLQDKNGYFQDISRDIGIFNTIKEAHSMEPADYDLDGDQDLFASHQVRDTTWRDTVINGTPQKVIASIKRYMQVVLLENRVADIVTTSNYHRWISVKLEAPEGCNRSAIGARIYVYSNGQQYMQDIQSGLGHFAGQQPLIRNFPLDYAPHNIDSIIVRWPRKDMKTTVAKGMPLNTIVIIDSSGFKGYKKTWDMQKPVLAVRNSNLNFGKVNVGETKEMDFELINLGDTPLTVTSINGLTEEFEFLPAQNFPLTIQPGKENGQKITIKFTPVQREEIRNELIIHSDAYNDSLALLRYYAYGFEEKPIIASDTNYYDFGSIYTDSSATRTITLQNKGELDLVINGIDVSTLPAAYTITDTPSLPLTILPGNNYTLNIEFKPTEEKEYSGNIIIKSNAYNDNNFTLQITGNGEQRKPQINVTIKTYLFGNVPVGNTREKTIKIQNTGTGELIIHDFTFENPFQDNFIFKNFTLPVSIAPLGMKELTLEFKPTAVQSYKTKVYLHSNSAKDSVLQLQFLGTGLKPTDVSDNIDEKPISIYPNPATNTINIFLNKNTRINSIQIADIRGRVLIRKSVGDILNGRMEMDIKGLSPGVYFIIVNSNYKYTTYPIIKE